MDKINLIGLLKNVNIYIYIYIYTFFWEVFQ